MRKNCNRILALLLACVLTFAMAGQALAADTASPLRLVFASRST